MQESTTKYVNPTMDREAIFARLDKVASVAQMSKEDRIEYNAELKTYRDYFNQMDYAKKTSRAEGRAEGILSVARQLRTMGMTIAQIAQATGLCEQEISTL